MTTPAIIKTPRVRNTSAGHVMHKVSYSQYSIADKNALYAYFEGRLKDEITISLNGYCYNGSVSANARCSVPKYISLTDPLVITDSNLVPRTWGGGTYSMSASKQQAHVDYFIDLWTNEILNTFGLEPTAVVESVVKQYSEDIMTDVVVKDFAKLRSKGVFVFNPMEHNVVTGEFGTDEILTVAPTSLFDPITCVKSPVVNHSQWTRADYKLKINTGEAKSRLSGFSTTDVQDILDSCLLPSIEADTGAVSLSQAKSNFTSADLDLLISLAEAPDTFMTLFSLLAKARDIIKSIKTGAWRQYAPKLWKKLKRQGVRVSVINSAKYSADIWLEMRYAIRPIYYDIVGILKVIEGTKPLTDEYITLRGFNAEDGYDTFTLNGAVPDAPGSIQVEHSYEVTARSGILAEILMSESKASLGLGNIGSLIWDSLTLSFVVGWFIDVGQLLYDANSSAIFSEKGIWTTVKTSSLIRGYKVSTLSGSTTEIPFQVYVEHEERIIDPVSRYFILDIKLDIPKLIDIGSLLVSLSSLKKLSGR